MMRRQSWTHTLLQILMLVALPATISWAESAVSWDTRPYEWSAQTVTNAGRVRVTITKTKPKLHLAKQQRPALKLVFEDDDTDYYDELPDIQVGYRRPELVNQTATVDLSDEIKIRLALARLKALKKHQEMWG